MAVLEPPPRAASPAASREERRRSRPPRRGRPAAAAAGGGHWHEAARAAARVGGEGVEQCVWPALLVLMLAAASSWPWLHSQPPKVPLVDLGVPALQQRVAWRTAAALGVVRLAGHGLDIDAVLNATASLFALPHDVKAAATSATRGGGGGGGGVQRG